LVLLIVALVVAVIVGVPVALSWRYRAARRRFRRRWKNAAVERIARLSEDASWIQEEIRAAGNGKGVLRAEQPWLREEVIVMADGDRIVYRSTGDMPRHDRHRMGDLFIGRASNGKWYYSSYHFCGCMYNLMTEGQPPDLARFIKAFSLVEFDGKSDKCLGKTWDHSPANAY
jgi:hypothetical protein